MSWRFGSDPGMFVWAYAIEREKTVYLRPSTCATAHRFVAKLQNGQPYKVTEWEIGSYATLLHEAMHVQGVRSERMAECLANDSIRWAASGQFRVSMTKANRLSRMAFNVSRKVTAPQYHSVSGVCQSTVRATDWTAFAK